MKNSPPQRQSFILRTSSTHGAQYALVARPVVDQRHGVECVLAFKGKRRVPGTVREIGPRHEGQDRRIDGLLEDRANFAAGV